MEIKFRAWDKNYNKMRKVDSIAFDKKGNIKVVNVWGYDIIEQKDIIISFNSPEKLKRIVLMQCTGLKDKSGEEIYDGDIISGSRGHLAVVLQDKLARFITRPIGCAAWPGLSGKTERYVEVIGNIHDNPELLEEVKMND